MFFETVSRLEPRASGMDPSLGATAGGTSRRRCVKPTSCG